MSSNSDPIIHRSEHAPGDHPLVIREARSSDRVALERLAERDCARVPAEPLIVAEVGGELRAAVSVADGRAIADPFEPTAELAALVEMRAAQVRSGERRRARIVARTSRQSFRAARHPA